MRKLTVKLQRSRALAGWPGFADEAGCTKKVTAQVAKALQPL